MTSINKFTKTSSSPTPVHNKFFKIQVQNNPLLCANMKVLSGYLVSSKHWLLSRKYAMETTILIVYAFFGYDST